MGLGRRLLGSLLLFPSALLFLSLEAQGGGSDGFTVKFLEAPRAFSPSNVAPFRFEVLEEWSGYACTGCSIKCKLDDHTPSTCGSRKAYYTGLPDGEHKFEVCVNGHKGVGCASYSWSIDTVSPTAYISASTYFTNAENVSVDISFSEPCSGGGGFRCFMNDCNLLVYGAGQVVPSTLRVLQPELKYSLLVSISTDAIYGRLVVVMDKNFCTDRSGNRFTRSKNSSVLLHFDRRAVSVDVKTCIPKKLLEINSVTRTVEATNNDKNLKVYLYFSEPVVNSSSEILSVLHTTAGTLIPTNRSNLGNRRFGFLVKNVSRIAIVSLSLQASSIISRQGTPVSPSEPATFLYDAQRPSVILSTSTSMRKGERIVPVLIKFVKPVFGFNSSALVIYGGHLLRFREISRSIYTAEVHPDKRIVSVKVLENTTFDVAGNANVASNLLQVRQYSVPVISSIVSGATTIVFIMTSFNAALLAVSTASLLSLGALPQRPSYSTSEPSRNLMRIAYHIQVFAQSKWLAVTMPTEYYEFARGLQWCIPYLSLPWENKDFLGDSAFFVGTYSETSRTNEMQAYDLSQLRNGKFDMNVPIYGMPLTPIEYRSFLENENMKPEAEYILASRSSNGWKDFGRSMFWLAIIGGGLMVIHAVILFTLKFRRKNSDGQNNYGSVVFPRFEIFLIFLALPCVCQASSAIIEGHSTGGIILGILFLGVSSSLLLSLILFISLGISMGKLLQYKEVHQEGQKFHWYQEIVRVSLGPGKRGQWTWKDQANSIYLTKLGPLFEDLRGPPKYMLSQISVGGNREKRGDRIIASDDETEDAEAPFIQKLFGILRIYYTLLESVKRVSLGLIAGSSLGRSSKVPTLVALSITSFQLFFLVLKKPFIKKKVQLVEIISVASEVGVFASCLVLLQQDFSNAGERRVGIFMLAIFCIGFSAQMINEWYALYWQVRRLSPNSNSFSSGLKTALIGCLLIILPSKLLEDLGCCLSPDQSVGEPREEGLPASGQCNRNSGTSERPWLRQLRDLAKASFSKDDGVASGDPSTSQSRWSGFWGRKRSGSSSVTSSSDSKSKPKALYKDLEAIFSSK
uniref:Glutathione transport system permease protein gsiD n=1 Tax=Anthurium amnicola TaxID=1678845 RepID=A0A1D1YIJ6_9ARAE